REGVQLAVYSLIFEGVKNNLWEFANPAAGAAFMRELDLHQKAVAPRHVAEAPVVQGPVVVTKN
ncbi:MAG TPA: curli production assembly protein CsgG, partial [Bradyrhizobium sp.]